MQPSPWHHPRNPSVADDIDFEIKGQELQFIEIELDPGESAVAEAGALVWKDASVGMTTVFGDGSGGSGDGFMGKLLGAGKRLITGESLFTTVFTHNGQGKARVAFASPTPGAILPLNLAEFGGQLICQKDSFLAAARGVSIGIHFQKRVMTGLFGGEGFIMQRLDGDGWVFVQMGGTIVERELAPGPAAARRYRLPGRLHAHDRLRPDHGRRREERRLRRRGPVLRPADRSGKGLDPVPAVLPPRRPHARRRGSSWWSEPRRGVGAGRLGGHHWRE
jgi:uncharacterized protein (AIM24 family)